MSATGDRDLIERLGRLGDVLDVDDGIDAAVLGRLGEIGEIGESDDADGDGATRRLLARAAIVVAIAAVGVVAHPDGRSAVARWFGLDGLVVEVDPDAETDVSAEAGHDLDASSLGPVESEVVVVDGRNVLVSSVAGDLGEGLITKTVSGAEHVHEVVVAGRPGLWIGGGGHEVLVESPDGDIVTERVAADTLLWNAHGRLYRVEGFDDVDAAVAFAERRAGT